jgi:hypothetical protein
MTVDRSIFAERGFAYYFSGQALSYLGDGMRALAIPLLVFHLTGSALSTGVTYALEILPIALAVLDRILARRSHAPDALRRNRRDLGCCCHIHGWAGV